MGYEVSRRGVTAAPARRAAVPSAWWSGVQSTRPREQEMALLFAAHRYATKRPQETLGGSHRLWCRVQQKQCIRADALDRQFALGPRHRIPLRGLVCGVPKGCVDCIGPPLLHSSSTTRARCHVVLRSLSPPPEQILFAPRGVCRQEQTRTPRGRGGIKEPKAEGLRPRWEGAGGVMRPTITSGASTSPLGTWKRLILSTRLRRPLILLPPTGRYMNRTSCCVSALCERTCSPQGDLCPP